MENEIGELGGFDISGKGQADSKASIRNSVGGQGDDVHAVVQK